MRDVASQLICRTSSSGRYSRTDSNSVPRPNGPRVRCPGSRKRPRRSAITSRRAAGTSGYASTGAGSPRRERPGRQAQRTGAAGGGRGQVVPAAAGCDERGVEPGRPGRWRDRDIGWLGLPDPDARGRVAGNPHREVRRNPARDRAGHVRIDAQRPARDERVVADCGDKHEYKCERERHRYEQRDECEQRERDRGARRGTHRGMGTMLIAVRTASSVV